MPSGQPGANSRGRGGKFKKYTRGGGKHFSRDLRPVDSDGNEISMWATGAKKKDDDDGDEDSEEDSEEDSDDSEAAGPSKGPVSRDARKQEKKARKEAAIAKAKGKAVQVGDLPPSDSDEDSDESGSDDDMPANPNHSKAARSQTKAPARDVDEAAEGVAKMKVGTPSRKERESIEAQQAKEHYRRLHEAGKTDEAKADLARLKIIREKREAEAARKQAEKEEKEAQEKAKKAEIEAKEAKKREAALGPKSKGKGKK